MPESTNRIISPNLVFLVVNSTFRKRIRWCRQNLVHDYIGLHSADMNISGFAGIMILDIDPITVVEITITIIIPSDNTPGFAIIRVDFMPPSVNRIEDRIDQRVIMTNVLDMLYRFPIRALVSGRPTRYGIFAIRSYRHW